MRDFMILYLSLSLSGSVIALLLLFFKPFTAQRFTKKWHYYIWIIVLLRFLIPVTPPVSLMGNLFDRILPGDPQQVYPAGDSRIDSATISGADGLNRPGISADPGSLNDSNLSGGFSWENDSFSNSVDGEEQYGGGQILGDIPVANNTGSAGSAGTDNGYYRLLLLIFPVVSLILLAGKIAVYIHFNATLQKTAVPVPPGDILNIYESAVQKIKPIIPPRPYFTDKISVPAVTGIIAPRILLPVTWTESAAAADFSRQSSKYIFRHELIHCKRMDILYKWLLQIVLCLHWFNPLVYVISREVNRYCELSCDEAVIKDLDECEKIDYGDTLLLSIREYKSEGQRPQFLTAPLSENADLMKERLNEIMKHSKSPKRYAFLSLLLACTVLGSAVFTGAYAADYSKEKEIKIILPAAIVAPYTMQSVMKSTSANSDKSKNGYQWDDTAEKKYNFSTYPSRTEALYGSEGFFSDFTLTGSDDFVEVFRKASTPNTVAPAGSLPVQSLNSIEINNDAAAVVLEFTGQAGTIDFQYIGMKDPSLFTLNTEVKEGVLYVDWKGDSGEDIYLDVAGDHRINTLLIRVPSGQALSSSINQGSGLVLLSGPTGPVTASTRSGKVLIDAGDLTYDCIMESGNGSLDISAKSISSQIKMTTKNGSALVTSEEVSGTINLEATNGSVKLSAETVTGTANLEVTNGSAKLSAETLGGATVRARNGNVNLSSGQITGNVTAAVTNGSLDVSLLQNPRNLRFAINESRHALPAGWYDGVVFGNGIPTLNLECNNNGNFNFKVGS